MRFYILLLTAAISGQIFANADSLSIQKRRLLRSSIRTEICDAEFENPALMPWKSTVSLGAASVMYHHRHGSKMALSFDPDKGENDISVAADAYILTGGGATWGEASYTNGKLLDRTLCESSDYDMVYPYVHATVKGGDLRMEHYYFGGGWSGTIRDWSIGARLFYDAGLYFRRVDPRPRNRTGNLLIGVGGSYALNSAYRIAAFGELRRYTQSSDITFVSEEGRDIIYHLTGLATQYQRFAGQGTKMNYSGYTPGFGIQLFPASDIGLLANATWHHTSMRCIIEDVNRLPLANIGANRWYFEAGWTGVVAAKLGAEIDSRTGTENIFGDAASGVYPKIGSRKMYHSTTATYMATVIWRKNIRNSYVQVSPRGGYRYLRQTYDGTTRILEADRWQAGFELKGNSKFGKGFFVDLQLDADFYLPSRSNLELPVPQTDIATLMTAQQQKFFQSISKAAQHINAGISASKDIGSRYAVGAGLQWDYLHSAVGENFNALTASIQFYF